MCCCNKILNFCTVGTCENSEIDFGIVAQHDGIHKLVTTFKGVQFTVEKTFSTGDQIKFPTTDLNENYTFNGQLFDPSGVKILIEKDGVEYDCFEFKTIINYVA